MNWKFFAQMAAGMLESAGFAKEAEDENDEGVDDLIGQGLVFGSHFLKWLLSGMKGKAPAMPTALAEKK
jgi:hypothetical protein